MDSKRHNREITAALDYEGLKQIGLSYIQNASRKTWTDLGIHDPGITMLEQLCFALVDLGYRTSFDIKDVMARMPQGESLLSPESILSCSPVTVDDYRKLILEHFRDKVRNVHFSRKDRRMYFDNALSKKLDTNSVEIAGQYHVQVELTDEYYSRSQEIIDEIKSFLNNGYRNLCESFDFTSSSGKDAVLEKLSIGIHAKIVLDGETRYDKLTKEIENALRDYVTPSVPYHSFEELIEKGMGMSEIFEGSNPPDMDSFVTYEDLAGLRRRTHLYLSDLKSIILSIKGVKSISHLGFVLPEGETRACVINESLVLNDQMSVFCLEPFRFDNQSLTRVAYVINGIPFEVGKNIHYSYVESNSEQSHSERRPLSVPREEGNYRESDVYLSPQNEFPEIYHIGKDGTYERDSEERKLQRLQLKAYLSFFDQLLSDYLEQLTKVGQFLSWDHDAKSYYHHILTDDEISDVSMVIQHYSGYEKSLDEDLILERKNAVLDHLLARFNESFVDYSIFRFLSGDNKLEFNLRDSVDDKVRYLKSYAEISSHRSQGANLSSFMSDSSRWHYGILENKISRKLGVNSMPDVLSEVEGDSEESFNEAFGLHVLEHNLLLPSGTVKFSSDNFLRLTSEDNPEELVQDPYSAQITVVLPGWMKITRHSYFREVVEKIIFEEVPAHISVKICWLSREVMHNIEVAYPRYLASLSYGTKMSVAKELSEVLSVMSTFRNIYPMSIIFNHDETLLDAEHDILTELDFSSIGDSDADGVLGFSLIPPSVSMKVGNQYFLQVNTSSDDVDPSSFEWHSSREDVAYVDQKGRVISLSVGESVISLSDNHGHVSYCHVTVAAAVSLSNISKPEGVIFEKKEYEFGVWSDESKNRLRAFTIPSTANKDLTFESLDPGIAIIDAVLTTQTNYLTPVAPGEALIVARTASGEFADFCKVRISGILPGEVEMHSSSGVYQVGVKSKVWITFSNDGLKSDGASFESSDPSVIRMTDNGGSFETLAVGTSTITFGYPGQDPLCSLSLSVRKVVPVCKIEFVEKEPIEFFAVGWTQRLNWRLEPEQEKVFQNLKVTSSDESVVTARILERSMIDGMVVYGVMVTTTGNGRAIITVSDDDGYALSGSCEIIVRENDDTPNGVTLEDHELEIRMDEHGINARKLTAHVSPSTASQDVYFESADPDVAYVDPGLVTSMIYVKPVKPGETTITVWDTTKQFSDTLRVVVKPVLKEGDMTVCAEHVELVVGDEEKVYLKGSDDKSTSGCVFWSSNPEILQVGDMGFIQAISPGKATICYGYPGIPIGSLDFVILAPTVAEGIAFFEEDPLVIGTIGWNTRMDWHFVPEKPTDTSVMVESSDESVVTCVVIPDVSEEDGHITHGVMVTPVGYGKAIVTITTADRRVSASREVIVGTGAPDPTGLVLDAHELELEMSDYGVHSKCLTATVMPEGASQIVYFKSDNPDVVKVDENLTAGPMLLTPVHPGAAVVTVYDESGRFMDSCNVRVKGVVILNATIEPEQSEYSTGIKSKLWLTSDSDVSLDGCSFISSNPEVLRFTDPYGSFETLSEGVVLVSYGYSGEDAFATKELKVVDYSSASEDPEEPESIEITEPLLVVRQGDEFKVPMTVKPEGFEWISERGEFVTADSAVSIPDCRQNIIRAVECGYAMIEVYYGGCSANCEVVVCPSDCDPATFVPAQSFDLEKSHLPNMKVGEKRTLKFSFIPADATPVLKMTSSDEEVLIVNPQDFSVEALAPGSVDVVVESYYLPWPKKITFVVSEESVISLPETIEINMNDGFTDKMTVRAETAPGINAGTLTYNSSNPSVLRVVSVLDDDRTMIAKLTPLFPGESVLTANIFNDPSLISNQCKVIVKGLDKGSVKFVPGASRVAVGDSGKFTIKCECENALTDGLEIISSDPKILEIHSGCFFNALSPGTVTITYGYPGYEPLDSLTVEVFEVVVTPEEDDNITTPDPETEMIEEPESIEFKTPVLTVRQGDEFEAPLTVKPEGFEWIPERGEFVTGDSAVSIPDSRRNIIRANECGYAIIEAYYGGCSASCEVIICPPECDPAKFVPVDSFSLAGNGSPYMKVGERRTLKFSFEPADATPVLMMASSDESVLRVEQSDFSVEALAPGSADVTIKSYHYPWPLTLSFVVSGETVSGSGTDDETKERGLLSLPEVIEISVNDGHGGTMDVRPDVGEGINANRISFEWEDPSVMKIIGIQDESMSAIARVIPLFPGETVMSAFVDYDPSIRSNNCKVIIKGLEPGVVKLHSPVLRCQVGYTAKLWTEWLDEKAWDYDYGLEFITSDPKILDFTSKGGVFTSYSPGTVVVSYGYPGSYPLDSIEIEVY